MTIEEGFENFLSAIRQGKDIVPLYANIYRKAQAENVDATSLTAKVAKAVVNALTQNEQEIINVSHQIELSEGEKAELIKKGARDQHEFLIQKILVQAFKSTKNNQNAIKKGITSLQEYCSSLVEAAKRPKIKIKRDVLATRTGPQPMQVEPEIIEIAKQSVVKKRPLEAAKEPEEPPLKRLESVPETAAPPIPSPHLTEKQKLLKTLVEESFPNLKDGPFDEEKYQNILSKLHPLYDNIDQLFPLLSMAEQTNCLAIVHKGKSFEAIEVQLFNFLREIVKTRFVQKTLDRPLLPIVEKIFPHSILFSSYFQLLDSLYTKYKNLKTEFSSPLSQDFAQKQLTTLFNSQFTLPALVSAATELGRLEYLLEHEPASIPDYIQHPSSDFIQKRLPKLDKFQVIFSNYSFDIASYETQVIDKLSEALVRPDGAINSWIIPDLKEWVKKQISNQFPSLSLHLERMLSQIQESTKISPALSASKIPVTEEGCNLVRASCHVAPNEPITLCLVNRAILSALLCPWRQYYFGSCHTTAPLISIKSRAIEVVVDDMQNLISKGSLTRSLKGTCLDFRAPFSLYPCSGTPLNLNLIDTAKREAPKNQDKSKSLCAELSKQASLILAWKFLQAKPPDFLPSFLYTFFTKLSTPSFTLQDIVEAMRVEQMERDEFDRFVEGINSTCQMNHCERLTNERSLQMAWEALQPHKEATLKDFFQTFFQKSAKPSCTLQDIVEAMKPEKMDQADFDKIFQYLNSYYQNPLLQTWQNGVMSMHILPLYMEEVVPQEFKTALQTALKLYGDKVGLVPNPFSDPAAFSKAKDSNLKTLKTLRFTASPPQTKEQIGERGGGRAIMNLCVDNPPRRFEPITHEGQFFTILDSIFFDFTGKHMAAPQSQGETQALKAEILTIFSKTMELDQSQKPWCYSLKVMDGITSPLYSAYFSIEEGPDWSANWEIIKNVDTNLETAIEQFRDWVIQQKEVFGGVKRLKNPAIIQSHELNALINTQIAQGPKNSQTWREIQQQYLKDLEVEKLNFEFEEWSFIEKEKQEAFAAKMKPLPEEKLLHWYERLGKQLNAYGVTEAEKIDRIELILFQNIVQNFPNIKRKLVYKFADTNATKLDPSSGRVFSIYTAFAIMPNVKGEMKWHVIRQYGNVIEKDQLDYFIILGNVAALAQSVPTHNLLLAKTALNKSIKKYADQFIELWKLQSSKENITDQRPNMKKKKALFQNAVNKVRQDFHLDVNQELFITMYNPPDAAGALEALFEENTTKIDALTNSSILS